MAIPTLTDFTMSEHTTMASVDESAYYEHSTSLHFADADGDTLTYSATLADGTVLPSWLSMDATTGILSGTPTYNDAASINITVTATDITGGSISDSYTLTVNNTNEPPELVNPESDIFQLTKEQENFSFDTSELFYDADGDALTYTAQVVNEYQEYSVDTDEYNWVETVSVLPEWLSIDAQTGVISGTPGDGDATIIQSGVGVLTEYVISSDSKEYYQQGGFKSQGEESYQLTEFGTPSIYYDEFGYGYGDFNYRNFIKEYESGYSIHNIELLSDGYNEWHHSKTNESGVVIKKIDAFNTNSGDNHIKTVELFDDGGNLTQTIVQTQLGNIGVIDNAIDFEQGPNYQPYASYVDEFVLNYYSADWDYDDGSETLFDVLNNTYGEVSVPKSLYVKEYYDSQDALTDTTYVIRGYGNYGSSKIEFDNADTIIKVVEGRGRYPEYDVTIVIEPADLVDRGSYRDDTETVITSTNSFGLVQTRYAQYIDVSMPLEIEITAADPSGATVSDYIDLMVQPESQSNVVDTTNTMAANESDTPLFFEFLASFDDALAASSVIVDGVVTETVTDTNGVIWTQTFEYAIQTAAGTATETDVITNSDGFLATIVGTADYSGTLADLQSSNIFDSGDSVWLGTGGFGNGSLSINDLGSQWTGQFVTVDGGLLTSVNLQLDWDTFTGNGSAIRDGQTITFDEYVFNDLPVLELANNEPQPPVDDTSTQLIQIRNTDTITKARASIDEYGEDYTSGNTDKLMKFELWIDTTELDSFGVGATEIRGYEFDINWNDLEVG